VVQLPRKVIFCFLFAFLFTTCAHIRGVDKSIQQQWLPFIEDGKTTKDEVLLKLGKPSGQFEGGRIFTYPMKFSEEEGFRVDYEKTFIYHHRWFKTLKLSVSKAEYNLMLVFDDKNILSKHNLLKVNPWKKVLSVPS
jgi:hypothetical protein